MVLNHCFSMAPILCWEIVRWCNTDLGWRLIGGIISARAVRVWPGYFKMVIFVVFLSIEMCCELFIWRLMVWKCSILRFFASKMCKDIQCIVSVGYLCVTRWTCDKDLFSVTVFKCFLFGGLCLNVSCSECLVALCLEGIFWSACWIYVLLIRLLC